MADVTPIFNNAAGMFGLDPILPQAVARVESGGQADPDRAVSSSGALGRMQIMPANLQRMNVRDPTDPEQNIYAGTSMLDEALTTANGNVPLALRIYQGGSDQSKWGPQNAAYPAKVGAAYAQIVRERAQAGGQSQGAPPPPPPLRRQRQPARSLMTLIRSWPEVLAQQRRLRPCNPQPRPCLAQLQPGTQRTTS